MKKENLNVSWFSTGVSSAVATKLVITELDQILYTHIDDQHSDTLRFIKDCEMWFGKEIQILTSQKAKSVEEACLSAGGKGYINGPTGASCTRTLKRQVRQHWENEIGNDYKLTYFWGMDYSEQKRADRVCESLPEYKHRFPLIEHKIGKTEAHEILNASSIKRPAMYDLGYHNNNCVGCVKGGAGYWNKIRIDFPEVFMKRAELERKIGASCIKGIYLDELSPSKGRHQSPIVDECGLLCSVQAI